MFQYALYRKFLTLGIESRISLDYFDSYSQKRTIPIHGAKYLLESVFSGLLVKVATKEEEKKYKPLFGNPIVRQVAKSGFIRKYKVEDMRLSRSTFHPNVLQLTDAYLDGYWQSSLYFEDILEVLRKEFRFKGVLNEDNARTVDRIESTNSVSIHIRRNDYLKTKEYEILGKEYYSKAISLVNERITNPRYFVFSNDISWCRQNLDIEATFVDWNRGDFSYFDMLLMSKCKTNIVANSTFSIWASLLNQNVNKLVIYPYKYFRSRKQKTDFWPANWTEIVY